MQKCCTAYVLFFSFFWHVLSYSTIIMWATTIQNVTLPKARYVVLATYIGSDEEDLILVKHYFVPVICHNFDNWLITKWQMFVAFTFNGQKYLMQGAHVENNLQNITQGHFMHHWFAITHHYQSKTFFNLHYTLVLVVLHGTKERTMLPRMWRRYLTKLHLKAKERKWMICLKIEVYGEHKGSLNKGSKWYRVTE